MTRIRVKVLSESGEIQEVEVPLDVEVEQLLKVLPSALGRPVTDARGGMLSYRLYNKDEEIAPNETLSSAGVADGSDVTLAVEGQALVFPPELVFR